MAVLRFSLFIVAPTFRLHGHFYVYVYCRISSMFSCCKNDIQFPL